MIDLLVVCRILLAGVFAAAGLAKAANPQATRRAFVDLGGPPAAARSAAVLLPAVEIAIAVGLLFRATARQASGVALLLLALFTLVLLAQFRKSVRPACPCFGFSRPQPVGRAEVLRNLALGALAGGIFVAGRSEAGPDVGNWLAAAPRVWVFCGFVLLAAFGIATRSVRARGRAESPGSLPRDAATPSPSNGDAAPERLLLDPPRPDDGLPIGALAPLLSREAASAEAITARPRCLLFANERFPSGRALLEQAIAWEHELSDTVELVRVADPELALRFRVRWTPAALLLDERGRVATPVRHGAGAVHDLVRALREASASGAFDRVRFAQSQGVGLPVGDVAIGAPAPPVCLPDARGALRDLHELVGRETALLFWHPDCPHCRGIAPALRRHEAQAAATSPGLVFVTAGPLEAARRAQAAFASVSLFDPELAVAPRFGARGTPSAMLLDSRGRIGSALAVGGDNVLALLGCAPCALADAQ